MKGQDDNNTKMGLRGRRGVGMAGFTWFRIWLGGGKGTQILWF